MPDQNHIYSVSPEGKFVVGIHRPKFTIANLREKDFIEIIGTLPDGTKVRNDVNFPDKDITEKDADIIYEIPNPFPFRGTAYINSKWADKNAQDPDRIKIEKRKPLSFQKSIKTWLNQSRLGKKHLDELYSHMPRPLIIAIAEASTDPEELVALSKTVCTFIYDKKDPSLPVGLMFKEDAKGKSLPDITDFELFEIIANNRFLPDMYKNAMVLVPGIQGASEITNDIHDDENKSHVFEYLRRNSYIPWGHFAANMADNCIRYSAKDLKLIDMEGMRNIYYRRTYIRLAEQLGIKSSIKLEDLRLKIIDKLEQESHEPLEFDRSLWGWNFGFGFSHSGYNLHASHQQVHQQFAMIPKYAGSSGEMDIPSYSSGDLVEKFVMAYKNKTGTSFFENYLNAVNANRRTDGDRGRSASLKVFEDDNIVLFVPKAQTSQFELQLMPKKTCGNILEADINMRKSIDRAILTAVKTLENMGAGMVTSIEFSKRFDLPKDHEQNIFYSFLPKLPMSPGAFSEAQLRWVIGHFPEDFAAACRTCCSIPA